MALTLQALLFRYVFCSHSPHIVQVNYLGFFNLIFSFLPVFQAFHSISLFSVGWALPSFVLLLLEPSAGLCGF